MALHASAVSLLPLTPYLPALEPSVLLSLHCACFAPGLHVCTDLCMICAWPGLVYGHELMTCAAPSCQVRQANCLQELDHLMHVSTVECLGLSDVQGDFDPPRTVSGWPTAECMQCCLFCRRLATARVVTFTLTH